MTAAMGSFEEIITKEPEDVGSMKKDGASFCCISRNLCIGEYFT